MLPDATTGGGTCLALSAAFLLMPQFPFLPRIAPGEGGVLRGGEEADGGGAVPLTRALAKDKPFPPPRRVPRPHRASGSARRAPTL